MPTSPRRAGCLRAVEAARERFGTVEAVINNAGIGMSCDPARRGGAPSRHRGADAGDLRPLLRVFVRAPATLVARGAAADAGRGFGRIVNNTTSYLTMLRVLPYGAAKAALEVDVGGVGDGAEGRPGHLQRAGAGRPTDTPLIADESGWDRSKMLRPEIMGPPIALAFVGRVRCVQRPAHHRGALGRKLPPARGGEAARAAPSAGRSSAPTRCGWRDSAVSSAAFRERVSAFTRVFEALRRPGFQSSTSASARSVIALCACPGMTAECYCGSILAALIRSPRTAMPLRTVSATLPASGRDRSPSGRAAPSPCRH